MTVGAGVLLWQANAQVDRCSTTLEYDGVSYAVYEVTDEIVGEDEAATGTERGCGDQGRWSQDVAVARVAGVDRHTALVTPVASHVLYLAQGVSVDDLPRDVAKLVAPRP